jgi:hypothetical protein
MAREPQEETMGQSIVKWVAAAFIVLPLIFLALGVWLALDQHHKITSYVEVPATVLSTDIEAHTSTDSDGHTSTSYEPVVVYRYEYDGGSYEHDEVFPLSMSAGRGWAQKTIDLFEVGQQTQAFVNPENPASAFLLKQYLFFPYLLTLFPMIFVSVGLGLALSAGSSPRKPRTPIQRGSDLYEVRPQTRIRDRMRAVALIAFLWFGVGALSLGHYYVNATAHYQTGAYVVTGIYVLMGMVPAGSVLHYRKLGQNVADARLYTHRDRFEVGDEVKVVFQQTFRRTLVVEKGRLGLVLEVTTKTRSGNKTTISTSKEYEEWTTFMENRRVAPGKPLEFAWSVQIPEDRSSSTVGRTGQTRRYHWQLELSIQLADNPDYKAKYPIIVREADPRSASA